MSAQDTAPPVLRPMAEGWLNDKPAFDSEFAELLESVLGRDAPIPGDWADALASELEAAISDRQGEWNANPQARPATHGARRGVGGARPRPHPPRGRAGGGGGRRAQVVAMTTKTGTDVIAALIRGLAEIGEEYARVAKPIEIEPWEMAGKRARVRVLRSLFNDCMAKVGVPTPSVDTETGEVLEGEVVQANGTGWSRLWITAPERNMEKADVHEHFGVPADDGALKDYAAARAKEEGKPLQQVVEDMSDEVGGLGQDEPAPPDDGHQAEEPEPVEAQGK